MTPTLPLLLACLAATLMAAALFALRRAVRDARQKQAWHRTLLDTAVDAVVAFDMDGAVLDCNPSAERLFGMSREEVLKQRIGALLPVGVDTGIALRRLASDGDEGGLTREAQAVRKDGRRVAVRVATGHAESNGQHTFVAFISDITARKTIEQALRNSELQLRSLVGNVPGIAFRCATDKNLSFLFISDAVERFTGYPAADFLGNTPKRQLHDLIHPEDWLGAQLAIDDAIQARRPFSVEYRLRHRDGAVSWMWSNGSPFIGGDGRVQWLDGVIQDISERKRSESAIRTLGAIVASSDDAIIGKTLDGVITSWNAGSEKMFGYTAAQAIGRPARMLLPPERADDEARALAGIARGEQADHFESIGVHADRHLIDLSVTLSPIHDERGQVVGASMIARDMTERRRMEVELRQAKEHAERAAEARAAFLANMSHEIRTPMNAILGFTDVLLMGSLSEQQRRHLDVVRNAGSSLLRLLDGVLDSAKLDRGAVELELSDFDLATLIDELAASHGATARAKGLTLAVAYAAAVPRRVHGDALRVRQVLTNLLSNAVKFTAAGRVDVSVEAEGAGVRMVVSDTGIGIPADRQSAIFEPFTQADATMSRRFGGTGLGTTISKQLVELMGGRIGVESQPGVGSRFEVRLPLTAARDAPIDAPRLSTRPALPPLRVLIADDVEHNLELLSLQLEPAGHRLTRARHGDEAVARAGEQRFDLILMDLQMPDVDGLQATQRIRAHETARGLAHVPVIALTASVQASDRMAARAAGMAGFVSKPVDPDALAAEMARVLGLEMGTRMAPGARDAGGEPQVLDVPTAMTRWLHRGEVYGRELQRFADGLEALQASLLSAGASGDGAEMRSLAHRTRGAAAGLGLDRLAAALLSIERAEGSGELAPAFGELSGAVREARQAVEEHTASHTGQAAGVAGQR